MSPYVDILLLFVFVNLISDSEAESHYPGPQFNIHILMFRLQEPPEEAVHTAV